MLVQVTYNNGPLEQPMYPGDILSTFELEPVAIANAAGVNVTAQQLCAQDIDRSGAAAVTDNLDTADNIVKAIIGSINKISPPDNSLYGTLPSQSVQLAWPANLNSLVPGSSFRRIIRSANSGVLTLAVVANSGVTLLGVTTIAATSWREYLIKILNATPQTLVAATTTNTSFVLTAVDLNAILNITIGMSVSGAGIAAGSTVVATNRDTGTITLSLAATASASNVAITLTPTVTVRGVRSGTPN